MPEHLVVREMLNTESLFFAFDDMPITRVRRYFVRDGVVEDHYPYWPAGALENPHARTAERRGLDGDEWLPLLRHGSVESPDEVAELTPLTERATSVLHGAWSVDWLWTTDRGWVLIDAAHAEESYTMPADARENLDPALDDISAAAIARVTVELARNRAEVEARSRDMSQRAVRQRAERYVYLRRQALGRL
jgi:hypothetical protein